MTTSALSPTDARSILRQTTGQDRPIFAIYAYTLARARNLCMDDIHADGKGRFWLRLLHRNNTETWHEIPSWLWHEILNRPPYWPLSKSFNHPVFSSPRHPDHFYSIQEINRKLRRYAELAGVRTNIRIQDLRGVLMEQAPVEAQPYNMIAECMSSRSLNRDHRLHGIGRRSAAMGVGNG